MNEMNEDNLSKLDVPQNAVDAECEEAMFKNFAEKNPVTYKQLVGRAVRRRILEETERMANRSEDERFRNYEMPPPHHAGPQDKPPGVNEERPCPAALEEGDSLGRKAGRNVPHPAGNVPHDGVSPKPMTYEELAKAYHTASQENTGLRKLNVELLSMLERMDGCTQHAAWRASVEKANAPHDAGNVRIKTYSELASGYEEAKRELEHERGERQKDKDMIAWMQDELSAREKKLIDLESMYKAECHDLKTALGQAREQVTKLFESTSAEEGTLNPFGMPVGMTVRQAEETLGNDQERWNDWQIHTPYPWSDVRPGNLFAFVNTGDRERYEARRKEGYIANPGVQFGIIQRIHMGPGDDKNGFQKLVRLGFADATDELLIRSDGVIFDRTIENPNGPKLFGNCVSLKSKAT